MIALEPIFRIVLLLIVCFLAARTDFRSGLIPNRITIGGIVLGLLYGAVQGGLHGVAFSFFGLLIVALPPLILFYRNAMGGGDVKLFGAVGSIVGVSTGMEIQILSFGLGAIAGVVMWFRAGVVVRQLRHVKNMINPLCANSINAADATRIRFAPFLLAAAVMISATVLYHDVAR